MVADRRPARGAAGLVALALVAACAGTPRGPSSPAVRERELDVGAVTLHVREVGDGARGTLIVVHGGPGMSHEYLRPLEALVADGLRVVSFDQRGAGRSTAPADPTAYGLAEQAADLEAVRAALGVDQIDVVGHSYGGAIAMRYAASYPAHVRSLVLVASVGPSVEAMIVGQWTLDDRLAELRAQGVVGARGVADGDDCAPMVLSVLPAYFYDPRHPGARDLGGSSCRETTFQRTLDAGGLHGLASALAGVRAPTLVVHGAADPFGTLGHALTVESLAGARPAVVMLPRCGHFPWQECGPPFFVALRSFLAARP